MQNPPTVVANAATADYSAVATAGICTYTYSADTNKDIEYDSATGAVVVTNP